MLLISMLVMLSLILKLGITMLTLRPVIMRTLSSKLVTLRRTLRPVPLTLLSRHLWFISSLRFTQGKNARGRLNAEGGRPSRPRRTPPQRPDPDNRVFVRTNLALRTPRSGYFFAQKCPDRRIWPQRWLKRCQEPPRG
jgi:hypothetical protein